MTATPLLETDREAATMTKKKTTTRRTTTKTKAKTTAKTAAKTTSQAKAGDVKVVGKAPAKSTSTRSRKAKTEAKAKTPAKTASKSKAKITKSTKTEKVETVATAETEETTKSGSGRQRSTVTKTPAEAARTTSTYNDKAVKSLWIEYAETKDDDIRAQLFNHYLPLLDRVVRKLSNRLPGEVDIDDLRQEGSFGLMDAIAGFELSRGLKFSTYATQRIRGSVLDYLRSIDWVPRLARSRARAMETARQQLSKTLGRAPTSVELREHLGVNKTEYRRIDRDSKIVGVYSMQAAMRTAQHMDDADEGEVGTVLEDKRQVDPLIQAQREDLKRFITEHLPRDERLIVLLYYYEKMSMKEIGITLGMSESRVSQKHSSIMERLKARFGHASDELVMPAA